MFVSKKKILGTEIKYKIYTSSVPTYGLFYLSRYRDFTIYLNRMYIKCLVRLLPTVCYWLQGSLCLISQSTRTVSFSPLIYNPLVYLKKKISSYVKAACKLTIHFLFFFFSLIHPNIQPATNQASVWSSSIWYT